jgi:hypothetical protein
VSLTNKGEIEMTKIETAINFLSLWVARLALAVLAVAGLLHLLGGVDAMIAYPVTGIAVAFLLKETL